MQPWAGTGRHCLFCSAASLFRPAPRLFTTTSTLQRSKPSKPSPSRASRVGSSKDSSPPTGSSIRQDVTAHKFSLVVEAALQDLIKGYKAIGAPIKGTEKMEKFVLAAARVEQKPGKTTGGPIGQLRATLQNVYVRGGMPAVKDELDYIFRADEFTTKYSMPNLEQQKKIADMRYPAEWYPQARSMQRTIHLHVGPTNSGKTYHALKRLENCERGFYAGPLRLLAQEVFQRFQQAGVPCSLITGDDVQLSEGQSMGVVSNTVEMVSLGQQFEVGVIDEIQMIADPKRGWAWTRAVLGSRATELHLCGEARAVPLIQSLAALTGDKLEIHNYERLSPLKVMDDSLRGSLKKLRKGDCVICFSRVGIHALKSDIEKSTGRRAAIVYGSLPAEIRTQQASLFNDPDNDYDFLVASDAIGMGLNLSIKRIIFETLVKKTPGGLERLSVPQIKQIAGRAGRYRPAAEAKSGRKETDPDANTGLVTSFESVDIPYIKDAMSEEPSPLLSAAIIPPDPVYHKFAAYFPAATPFHYIVRRVAEVAKVNPLFFMCDSSPQLEGSVLMDPVRGLRTSDRLTLMAAPIHTRNRKNRQIAQSFAKCVAMNTGGRLLDIEAIPLDVLEQSVSGKKEYLEDLETLHKAMILYLWLSFRFGGIFTDRTLASHVKKLTEERMVRALTEFSSNKALRRDASLRRQISLQRQTAERQKMLQTAELDGPGDGTGSGLPNAAFDSSNIPEEDDSEGIPEGDPSEEKLHEDVGGSDLQDTRFDSTGIPEEGAPEGIPEVDAREEIPEQNPPEEKSQVKAEGTT